MGHQSTTTSLLLVAAVIGSSVARAEGNSCATAYEQAQELRAEQHLQQARRSLEACVAPSCPEFVRSECGRWLVEVETSLPTIVLSAKRSGREDQKVRVLIDGATLVESLDGKAVSVDPGPHTLTFVSDGESPVELKLVFREGEKNRLIEAELAKVTQAVAKVSEPKASAPPSQKQETSARPSWLAYGFGGLGVLGVSGFALLGILGNNDLQERERQCAPTCSDAAVSSVRTKYYLADVSLGIGVVSLGVAGYLFLTSPSGSSPSSSVGRNSNVDVRLVKGGTYAEVGWKF